METTFLLVLLMMSADERSGETLRRFLKLYRENRALFAALSRGDAPADAPPAETAGPDRGQEKSRPRDEAGDASVLEEYLKKFAAI